MKKRSAYEKDIDRLISKLDNEVTFRLSAMQESLWGEVAQVIGRFKTDDQKKIKGSISNLRIARRGVRIVVESFVQTKVAGFLAWAFRKIRDLFGLQTLYYKSFVKVTNKAKRDVLANLMEEYGYDVATKKLLPGGWLSNVANHKAITANIMRRVTTSIRAKMDVKTFREKFRDDFINGKGLGLKDTQFNLLNRDLFRQISRSSNDAYANNLSLDYFIYAGTEKDNTRPFCEDHIGGIFHVSIYEDWEKEEWQGKNPHLPVKIALGGFNCRHNQNYISEEMAKILSKRRGRKIIYGKNYTGLKIAA